MTILLNFLLFTFHSKANVTTPRTIDPPILGNQGHHGGNIGNTPEDPHGPKGKSFCFGGDRHKRHKDEPTEEANHEPARVHQLMFE